MRLVTFATGNGARLGALAGDDVIDLAAADPELPSEVLAFLRDGDKLRERAQAVLADPPEAARRPVADVALLAPVPRPPKLVCVGLNYRDHAAETGLDLPEVPTILAKYRWATSRATPLSTT